MSLRVDLNKLSKEYQEVRPGNSKAKEFLGKVTLAATSILETLPTAAAAPIKAKTLADDLFAARFSEGQIEILRTSSDPLIHEAAKYLAIENYLNQKFPDNALGGCSVLIMRDGETLFSYSSGLATEGRKASPESPQHFGSVSKQFTAACVAILFQKRGLDLSMDIRSILPSLPQFAYQGRQVKITVDELLQMQSGLPDCVNLAFLRGIPDEDLSQEEKMAPLYGKGAIELAFLPGTRFHYCNSNYYLLSDIVTAISGKDLRTFAHEALFEPLGMNRTDFIDPKTETREQSVPGFSPEGRDITTKNKTWGACGVIGAPEDMVLWDSGAPRTSFWSLLAEDPPAGSIYSRGLHVEYQSGFRVIHHPGGIEGFQTMYLRMEKMDHTPEVSIFLASNRDGHEADVWAKEIMNLYLEKSVLKMAPIHREEKPADQVVRDPLEMMPHVGTYHSSMLGTTHSLELVQVEGKYALKMKPVGASDRFSFLFAQDLTNPHKFISIGGPKGAEIVFNFEGFVFQDPNVPIAPISFSKM